MVSLLLPSMSSPEKKTKTATKELSPTPQSTQNPSLPLPLDLQLNCLARLSRSDYPTLSLVCKTFGSLIASPELYKTRSLLNRRETCLHVCLNFFPNNIPRWFTLCRKPKKKLSRSDYPTLSLVCKTFGSLIASPELYKTRSLLNHRETCLHVCLNFFPNNIPRWFTLCWKPKKKTTSGNILVPIQVPESPSLVQASSFVAVGSDIYEIGGFINGEPTSNVSILDCPSYSRRQAPNMLMARNKPLAYATDGKISVVGGLHDFKSINKEVFDLKTQTWKFESVINEGIYESNVWNLWCIYHRLVPCCVIDNVFWSYSIRQIEWLDTKVREWRVLKGVEGQLPKLAWSCNVQLVDYGGKMAVLWHEDDRSSNYMGKVIWCAEIALERCSSEEIRGTVEWFEPVLKVHELFEFMSVLAATV